MRRCGAARVSCWLEHSEVDQPSRLVVVGSGGADKLATTTNTSKGFNKWMRDKLYAQMLLYTLTGDSLDRKFNVTARTLRQRTIMHTVSLFYGSPVEGT